MLEFLRRRIPQPPAAALGVLPAAFHPPTNAHLALARAGLDSAGLDEVLFVMPRQFPHKLYEEVGLPDRLRMVEAAIAGESRFSLAVSEGGLFAEIADECRACYGESVEPWFLCGRDAAERFVNWDYGRPGAIEDMLRRFGLLVAPRQGAVWHPPEHLAARVRRLDIDRDFQALSATEVRRRIRCGEDWEHLVPEAIRRQVRELYAR